MEIKSFLVTENTSLIDAMAKLDETARQILFVVKNGKLVASLTDGDIRRFILKKGSLDSTVSEFANYKPYYITMDEKAQAKKIMLEEEIHSLPIVDEEMKILSIVWSDEHLGVIRGTLKAPVVMMAGGMGTRLYPYTKVLPKPLIPINDVPIAERIINRFYQEGCDAFYLIVNHKANMIKAYFNEIERDYSITYIDEKQPLGTGGGLSLLKGMISETFFLSNCDILIDEAYEKIYNFHKEKKNLITMVCSLKNIKIPYGVIEFTENGDIDSMKEKPSISFFANTGLYLVEPEIIDSLEPNKPLAFPDLIEKYRKAGKRVGVYPIGEQAWLDMGQFDEMEKMNERLKNV